MTIAIPVLELALTTQPTSTPSWTDVSLYVVEFSFQRGRERESDTVNAGTFRAVLRNDDRRFDPSYTSGPYYGNLKRMRRLRLRATYSGATYDLYTGYIRDWTVYREANGQQFVSITADDGLRVLGMAILNTSYSQERTDVRVANVLNDAGWQTGTPWILGDATYSILESTTTLAPFGDRALDQGLSQVQAATLTNTNALEHLQSVELSELGLFFMGRTGGATFHNRRRRLLAGSQASLATFGEDAAGGELPYVNVAVEYDDSQLWNEVRVTRTGGTAQAASDATSLANHFHRTLSREILVPTDSEASAQAGYLVNRYKDPPPRIAAMVLDPQFGPDDLWARFLGAELGDVVTVRHRPWGGGNALEQKSLVESMAITFLTEEQTWGGTWTLSPTDTASYWVLGVGLLGTSTALGI